MHSGFKINPSFKLWYIVAFVLLHLYWNNIDPTLCQCWSYVTYLGPPLGHCWLYVTYIGPLLVICYVHWPTVGPVLVICYIPWPTVGPVLVICYVRWPTVGPISEDDKCDIVPMSAQHVGPMLGRLAKLHWANIYLPTLGQCNWFCWANVGPTKSCYLGGVGRGHNGW